VNALRDCAARWWAAATPTMRCSIVATRGSTPQASGASMLVCADQIAGTIGGGNLEWQAIASARRLLVDANFACAEERQILGANLGQCCGGSVQLRFERLNPAMLAEWPDEFALFELQIFGMGHVADALVGVLSSLSCVIHWHDERSEFVALRARQWQARNIRAELHLHDDLQPLVDRPSTAIGTLPKFALIMTHSHALDFDLCRALLTSGAHQFVGLIGSIPKRSRFVRKLTQLGLTNAQIQGLSCPIGLRTLKYKQPELLAVSLTAQLLELAQSSNRGDAARGFGDAGRVQGDVVRRTDPPHFDLPSTIHAALVN
jgi:xanthine dehydrogenase accessory factor